jgi:hypothetical protein
MRTLLLFLAVGLTALPALAQQRPYIGYVYPAGGRQGTTFVVRLGGQQLDGVTGVIVSGAGVTGRLIEYHRRLGNQEEQLLKEQLQALRKSSEKSDTMMAEKPMMMATMMSEKPEAPAGETIPTNLLGRLEWRLREHVATPACASISSLVFVEITVAPDAAPGERELRLVALRGISNPLAFCVGQVPEFTRKPMRTASLQVLGKEAQSLRKRPPGEAEDRVAIPCTLNGQIASGEVNRYRFAARQGQRIVITALARELIPYIADAVPGWFQPVLALYDAAGREVAYSDDYRFKPDPTIFFEVPKDGEYVAAIFDSIYRGREDFVYRLTIGELPFVMSIFPLGGRAGELPAVQMKGWNLDSATLATPSADPGICHVTALRKGVTSNRVPFQNDALPECVETEANNEPSRAQKVRLPVVINGRIGKPGDRDVFKFDGKAGDKIVAEVCARRLDSPLDSVIKLTDGRGNLVAFSDDREDLGSGINTHHADSYFMATLPSDGTYCVHLGDTAGKGGEEYAYRLRLSAPRPEFSLRVVPSSGSIRSKNSALLSVYVIRHDGFSGPIKLGLKNPPPGFSAAPVSLTGTQAMVRLTVKTDLVVTKEPVRLVIEGSADVDGATVSHEAVAAEDRMQAFLWRHLVPAGGFVALVYDPSYQPPPKHPVPERPPVPTNTVVSVVATNAGATVKGKFTKQQIEGRLRQLKWLYEEGLLTDEFYDVKVTECEAAQ